MRSLFLAMLVIGFPIGVATAEDGDLSIKKDWPAYGGQPGAVDVIERAIEHTPTATQQQEDQHIEQGLREQNRASTAGHGHHPDDE